jgi:LysR family transcriptional regulator, low CO2-responsive transcriptional regulator
MPSPIKRLMRISPQQLRAFEATARLMSITRAARELHVSQPTISVQLRQLAELVGEPLFEPLGRGIRLTLAGEALVDAVGDISTAWQRFEGRLSDLRGLVRGRLRIAAVTTAEYFVPDLLGPFGVQHPGIDIELAVENRDRVIARLHQQIDDLAVMMLPPEDLPLQSLPFLDNPLVVIAAAQHPLAGRGHPVPLEALSGERWLMREPGSGTRWVAERHFAAHGFTPRLAMSLGSNEALKHAVGAGLGIGVISALAVAPPGQGGHHDGHAPWVPLPVAGFPIHRQWSLVWRTDLPLAPPARQFVTYLERDRMPSGSAR